MKLLLDSCAIVWWLNGPEMLADQAHAAISNPSNQIFISAASVWELSLKVAKGKLRLPQGLLKTLVEDGMTPLQVTCDHAAASTALPPIHADPFDRILIAQALAEGMILVTRDDIIPDYPVPVMKA